MRLAELNPIERIQAASFELGAGNREFVRSLAPIACKDVRELSPEIAPALMNPMLALHSFSTASQEIFATQAQVYLLGDSAVFQLLALANLDVPHERDAFFLEVLATCGLLYRFWTAAKFGYEDGIMQLRASAWTTRLISTYQMNTAPSYRALFEAAKEILNHYRLEYAELLRLCASTERPLKTARLHALNKIVLLPIVT